MTKKIRVQSDLLNEIYKYNGGYFLKSCLKTEGDESIEPKTKQDIKFIIRSYKKCNKVIEIEKSTKSQSGIYKLTQKYTLNIFDSLISHSPEEIISRVVWIAFILENPNLEQKKKYFKYDSFIYNGTTYIIDDFKKELSQFPKNATIVTLPFREVKASQNLLNSIVPTQLKKVGNIKSIMNYISNNFKDFMELQNQNIEKYIEISSKKYILKNHLNKEDYEKLKIDTLIYNKFIEEYGFDPKTNSPIWEIENLNLLILENKSPQDKEKFKDPYYALMQIHSLIQT